MRINGTNRPGRITAAKGGGRKRAASGASGVADKVKVADAAALREKARVMIADMPEVRLERIEEIRDALERGEYDVDSKKVAARIVINALAEHAW